jgi:hypothetical protein
MAITRAALPGMVMRAWGTTRKESFEVHKDFVLSVFIVCAALSAATAQVAEPLTISGTYLENQVCKGDGSDPTDKRIKITATEIDSSFGLCTLNDPRRDGNKITYQVVCKDPAGGSLSSDVTFAVVDPNTLDFSDQYETYRAKLHKCP